MKKFLSFLIAAALIAAPTTSAFAGSGKNCAKPPSGFTSGKAASGNGLGSLKSQLTAVYGDKVKMTEILKKIAAIKKQTKDNKIDVYVNGKEVSEGTPVIRFGRALLLLGPMLKALKATYEIRKDGSDTKIIIKKDKLTLTITAGSNLLLVNDAATGKTTEYKLEDKVEVTKNGTLIPMGVIQKLIRKNINFDKDKGCIIIDDGKTANLALNMPAAASSTYGAGYGATYAVDGKADTRWSSEFTTAASFTVDLGAAKNIGRVKLAWEAAYAKVYAVQVSNDNLNWSDAAVVTNGDGGTDELTFGSVSARYVRLDLRERSNPAYGYSLYEFEVYASDIKAEASVKGKSEALLGGVNLTTEGVTDWAHWGITDAASFTYKTGVTRQIPNFITVGDATPVVMQGNLINYAWTDGTPTASAAVTSNAVYIKGQGNGFTLAIPAGLTQRTLKVYVGALDAKGRLEAILSGGTTYTGFIDSPGALKYGVFTIDFKAASAGQTLTIKYTVDKAYDASAGDISLQAMALR